MDAKVWKVNTLFARSFNYFTRFIPEFAERGIFVAAPGESVPQFVKAPIVIGTPGFILPRLFAQFE